MEGEKAHYTTREKDVQGETTRANSAESYTTIKRGVQFKNEGEKAMDLKGIDAVVSSVCVVCLGVVPMPCAPESCDRSGSSSSRSFRL